MSSMSPVATLQSKLPAFTKSELAAAQFFLSNPSCVVGSTISKASELCGQSPAVIVRMCQRAGYTGYSEFRFAMSRHLVSKGTDGLEADPQTCDDEASAVTDSFFRLADIYGEYMRKVVEAVDFDNLCDLAAEICKARRLSIWGVNRTFESVSQLSSRLFRLGLFNHTTDDPIVMDDLSDILTDGDACIVFSLNGRGCRSYGSLMQELVDRGCSVTLVTMNPKIDLLRHASRSFVLPWASNDYAPGALDDQMIVFMFIELLINQVARAQAEE